MVLQGEDILFDILLDLCPEYIFLVFMDQMSDYQKKLEGGLNATEISTRFDGI